MEDLEVKVTVIYSLTGINEAKPCRAHLSALLPQRDGKLRVELRGAGCWGYVFFDSDNVVVEDSARAATWSELDDIVDELVDDLKQTLRNNAAKNRALKDSIPPDRGVYFTV